MFNALSKIIEYITLSIQKSDMKNVSTEECWEDSLGLSIHAECTKFKTIS